MYVKVKDGAIDAFPYGFRELMQDNPNTSFPEIVDDAFLAQYGIHPVTPSEIPQPFDEVTQNAAGADPVFVDGAWVQAWNITDASYEQKTQRVGDLAQNIRATRGALLAETDWTQVADSPVDQKAWAAYRQALRDITKQPTFPRSVDWPAKP